MQSYLQLKELSFAETPLLLFDCQLTDGTLEHWSTHAVLVSGVSYAARVARHNVFELQSASTEGVDGIPKITLELANADSHFSELERVTGWKGAKLTASFLFYDLRAAVPASDATTLFKGIVNAPELVTETAFRVSAVNRLSLQRLVLPTVRIQRRCPWSFPGTAAQRLEAIDGAGEGPFSRYYRCGYSADIAGGSGNLNGTAAFTSCSFTRSDCTARGMFSADTAARPTARFGGQEFVPSTITVRSAGESGSHLSAVSANEARYNDFVPMVYGTAWLEPRIVFARNDGNLTRMEVLLGAGVIHGVLKVLVNDIEIPIGVSGRNMTGTGWFNVMSRGARQGAFNSDFADAQGRPLGDPYGSMAYLSLVVPNRINDGKSLPSVRVLLEGLEIGMFDGAGVALPMVFSNNPAWVILDILRRSGWALAEFDTPTFFQAAAFCAASITAQDLHGNAVQTPRFQCNLVLKTRRSAGDVVRGIRNASRLYLTYGGNGLLQLKVEGSLAQQQPALPPGSNSASALNGGFAAYEFGDGGNGFSGILRNSDDSSSVRLLSRAIADTPNRYSVEFQDAFNEYQQDSYSVVDSSDVASVAQEVSQTVNALGIPQYDQAARVLQLFLNKSITGNTQIEFDTSVKGVGLNPGDIITVSYAKEGLVRQPFRIQKLALSTNYRTSRITAQWHDDAWYSDTAGQSSADGSTRRHSAFALTAPRPIAGTVLVPGLVPAFGVIESYSQTADGSSQLTASVSFIAPAPMTSGGPRLPLVSLSARIASTGGALAGPSLYYGVSCVDANGLESALSFIVAATQLTGQLNTVTLQGLSFPPAAVTFNVYRGETPSQLFRIALNAALGAEFTDSGLALQAAVPPDPNFDHATFYWRMELQPEVSVTVESANTVGNSTLQMPVDRYVGKLVRITQGTGSGQERLIAGNTATVVTTASAWTIMPDLTSSFSISEASFQNGGTGKYSPVRFAITNNAGAVVQISGRSVNANDVECAYELSPLTRWTIGGAGQNIVDQAVAAAPTFSLDSPRTPGGTLLLSSISFPDLSNTSSITAGTLSLYYIDETQLSSTVTLASAVDASALSIVVSAAFTAAPAFVQIGTEIVAVVQMTGTTLQVKRGQLGSTAVALAAGTPVLPLSYKAVVIPFVRGFFGSPASGNWSYPIPLPNVRVASASLTVTNSQGTSNLSLLAFTRQVSGGIRTLSGGQYSFQVSGYLAIQTAAAPEILIDAPRVVRDVYALVNVAPVGSPITVSVNLNNAPFCSLTIPDGQLTPVVPVDGLALGPLKEQDRLSLDITGVGSTVPGSDLTVVVRV
ncbi:MAG TPA: hypothetical protein DEQ47_04305 [Solibacterales bacterium]|nr:hypothetical protein [Bryobacterales bacterium]